MKIIDDSVSKDFLEAIKDVLQERSFGVKKSFPKKPAQVYSPGKAKKHDYVVTPEGKVARVTDVDNDTATVKIHGSDETGNYKHSELKPYYAKNEEKEEEMVDRTELSEVTRKILGPYIEKAKEQIKSKPGRPSKEFTARKAKREKGISQASSKINKDALKLRSQMEQNRKERTQDVHDEFHKVAPKILKDHGFDLTSDHADRSVWTKVDPNHGHVHFAVISKKKPESFTQNAATALIGSTAGSSATRHNVYVPYVDDNHDETKKRVSSDFEKTLKDSKDYTARNIYEEVEKIDELHIKQKKLDANKNDKIDAEDFRILRKRKMKEGIEQVDEGRGRPPKEGSEAWKRRQAASQSGEDDGDSKHIIDDLRKASTNIKGEGPVRFKNGTTNVQRGHAIRILAKYMRQEKPVDKEEMQDRISNSYDHLKKEI